MSVMTSRTLLLCAFLVGEVLSFNIQSSSLVDLVESNEDHLSFVGSFQAVFPESADCTDACIYSSSDGDSACAQHERFYPTQISVSPSVWAWESAEIPAGEYSAMITTSKYCWEAIGSESDRGVMEPVPFTVPSYGSTVVMKYFEDVERVTVTVHPLVDQFTCHGKPEFVPDFSRYGGSFEEEDGPVIIEENVGFLVPEFNSLHSSSPTDAADYACDFPQLLAADYNISIIATQNVPDHDLLFGSGTNDPMIKVTLPVADPYGEWSTEAYIDCENCTIPMTFEGRTVSLGHKVGGSRLLIELWDHDVGFEWTSDFIGNATTTLMRCSFTDVRSDAVCGHFTSATNCLAWKPSQFNNNPNYWDENSCTWVNERCRGCEVYDTETSCRNGNCHWRDGTCTDVCSQEVWVPIGSDEPCATYDIDLDEWTFNSNISCVKIRQTAVPFIASIDSLLFEAGDMKVAVAGTFSGADIPDPECDLTAEEEQTIEDLQCDLLLDSLDFAVVRRAHPLCVPCQSSLDYIWKVGQGQAYVDDSSSRIDISNEFFRSAAGSTLIEQPNAYFVTDQGTVVYARKVTAPKWMTFRVNMDVRLYFMRVAGASIIERDVNDMEMIPTWVDEGITTNGEPILASGEPVPLGLDGGYKTSTSLALNFIDSNVASNTYYFGYYRDFSAGDTITLGGSAYGVANTSYFDQACTDDSDNFTSSACSQAGGSSPLQNQEFPTQMYLTLLRPRIDITDVGECDISVTLLPFFATVGVYFLPIVLYTAMVWWFLNDKIDYNFDMIPSYVARQVLTGKERNILGSIPATYKSGARADYSDVWFRRHLHYATKAIAMMCWSPIVIWSSFGISLVGTTAPVTFGLSILFLGNAALLGGCATLAWRRRQWRMTIGIRRLFMAAAVMVLLFLLTSAIFDACGSSFFSLTAAFLTVNMVVMSQVNFAACPHVAAAYHEIEHHRKAHDEVMAEIMESIGKSESKAGDGSPASDSGNGLTSYISECYTISGKYSAFKFSNAFVQNVSEIVNTARVGALASILALVLYCSVVRVVIPDEDTSALGVVITVLLLDGSVYMLRNGLMSWSPTYITVLMLLSRAFLVAFSSEYWIVGHAFAYSVFGIAVCREIVDQKLPRVSGLDAGAVAYFSRGDNVHAEQKRRARRVRNIAGSPVFVAGYLFVVLALAILLAIFSYGDAVPNIDFFGIDIAATSVAVGLVVINILVLLVMAASRALYLESHGLLDMSKYFCRKNMSVAKLLSAIFIGYAMITGFLLAAMTGSTVWIQISVFVPLIVVSGRYAVAQYARNDFSFSLTPRQRKREIYLWKSSLEDAAEREAEDEDEEEDVSRKSAGGFLGLSSSALGSKKSKSVLHGVTKHLERHTSHLAVGDHLKKEENEATEAQKPVVIPPVKREEDEEGYDPDAHQKYSKLFQLFWDGRLAPREYYTFYAMTCFILLSTLFCFCLAWFLRPWYIGAMTFLIGTTLVCGLVPLYQYAQTWHFNCGMFFSIFISFLSLCGFAALVFLLVFDASWGSNGTVVLISIIFWWPEFLFVAFTFQYWRERDFVANAFIHCSMIFFALCLFVFGGVILLWVQNFYLLFAYLYVVGMLVLGYMLVQQWLANDKYMPLSAIVAAGIVGICIIGAAVVAATFGADLLFCLSIVFLTISFALFGTFSGSLSESKEMPVGYNSSVFPTYLYDPMNVDVYDVSRSVWGGFAMMLVLLVWGSTCAVYFAPADLGIGLVSTIIVIFQAMMSYFSSKTVVQLGKALRCVDELILKTAAMKATEKYQARRSKFEIKVPQALEGDRKNAELIDTHLKLFTNASSGDLKTGSKEEEGLEETGQMLTVAQIRQKHFDTMHLKTAEYYGKTIMILQNNLRYADSVGHLKAEDKACANDTDADDTAQLANSAAGQMMMSVVVFLYFVVLLVYSIYFLAGYFYDLNSTEQVAQPIFAGVVLLFAAIVVVASGAACTKRRLRADGVYDDYAAFQDAYEKGGGPLGWLCCCGVWYRCSRICAAKQGGYQKVQGDDVLDGISDALKRFRGKKSTYKQQQESKDRIKLRGEYAAENLVETLNKLPVLHRCLDYQYREEMRAFAHFCLLVIQAADEHLAREGIRFQQFLREYRFKLLANDITPPRRIFTSKSYATIDVNLVASWLSSLTVEQKTTFDQLKATFTKDIQHQISNQIDEDEEEQEQADELAHERAHREYEMNCRRYEELQRRREQRERENRVLEYGADEVLENVNETLAEIASKGKDSQPGSKQRKFQFVDPQFPHDTTSLGDCQGAQQVVGWKEAREINESAALFKDGSDPDDVFQGELADQWLLSALSMVAASGGLDDGAVDPLIDNLFVNKETETGAYALKLWVNSQWETVIVDDFFPVRDSKFASSRSAGAAFGHSHNMSELWVPLVEKAIAKYYGSYAALERGFVHQALTLMTGAPTECLYLANASNGTGKSLLWRQLMRAHENGFILGAASITGDTTHKEILESGIMMNAAYLIYEVAQVGNYQLIKLRNPPDYGEGSPEWKGDWSDSSALWTKAMRKKLKMVKDENDNQFWMSYDDFCIIFRCVYVCKAINTAKWKTLKFQSSWSSAEGTDVGLPTSLSPDCNLTKVPQYSVFVHRPTDISIRLSQTQDGYATLRDPPLSVAVYVCRSRKGGKTPTGKVAQAKAVTRLTNISLVSHSGDPAPVIEATVSTFLAPGYYSIVCGIVERGEDGPFELEVTARHAVVMERIDPTLQTWKEKQKAAILAGRAKIDVELDKIAHITGENKMDIDVEAETETKPFNWVKLHNQESDSYYYYDVVTGVSTWDVPADWDEDLGKQRKEDWEKEKAARKTAKKAKKAAAKQAAGQ